MQAIVGQLAILTWRNDNYENADWVYGVVKHVFDGRIEFLLEDDKRFMYVVNEKEDSKINQMLNSQPTKVDVKMLYNHGMPVMAKKKLFGGYIPKPR